eukprot:SAG11_NODE_33590_length_276_cov_0.881356_1_plen_67_part_10
MATIPSPEVSTVAVTDLEAAQFTSWLRHTSLDQDGNGYIDRDDLIRQGLITSRPFAQKQVAAVEAAC